VYKILKEIQVWGDIPTINARLQMVCTFIDTLCKYTNLLYAEFEAELSMLLVGGWLRRPGDLVDFEITSV
jgi:hypothetical protein